MRRASTAVAALALLAMVFPSGVNAERVMKFDVHETLAFCDAPFDGGYASALAISSSTDQFAALSVWLGDAIPFEDPPSLAGVTASIDAHLDGDPITLSATIPVAAADGSPAGDAAAVWTMSRAGEPFVDTGFDAGNVNSHTEVIVQDLEGAVAIALPDETEVEVPCLGSMREGSVFETHPHTFSTHQSGVSFFCFWESEDTFAALIGDAVGRETFLEVDYFTPDVAAVAFTTAMSLDKRGVHASFQLENELNGDILAGTVDATFEPIGRPITSTLLAQDEVQVFKTQPFSVDGTFEVAPGMTLPMDGEHCQAFDFRTRARFTDPAGPRTGRAQPNDAPDGAVALGVGDRRNVQTTGTEVDAEVPNETCLDGPGDAMAKTLWYTLTGTGSPVTISTAGSNFDTVVAAYLRSGDTFEEIGCNDDASDDQLIPLTYQSELTIDSEEGVTYWIQVGGWDGQSGRLRLSAS